MAVHLSAHDQAQHVIPQAGGRGRVRGSLCASLWFTITASMLRPDQGKPAQRTSSTNPPVTVWTCSANAETCARSCSLAGVTVTLRPAPVLAPHVRQLSRRIKRYVSSCVRRLALWVRRYRLSGLRDVCAGALREALGERVAPALVETRWARSQPANSGHSNPNGEQKVSSLPEYGVVVSKSKQRFGFLAMNDTVRGG